MNETPISSPKMYAISTSENISKQGNGCEVNRLYHLRGEMKEVNERCRRRKNESEMNFVASAND